MSLFLSYSYEDNQDPDNWVTEFHDRLKKRLRSIKGEDIPVLLDRYDFEGNLLDDGIEEMLDRSNLLLTLISPSYLRKDWCTKERNIFIDAIKRKYPDNDKPEERLVAAIKLIEHGYKKVNRQFISALPDVLRRHRYFEFFALDKNENPITLLPNDQNFNITINDLAHKIINHLNRLNETNSSKQYIYLAETTRDHEVHRRSIAKELETSGYIVLPTALLPETRSEIGGSQFLPFKVSNVNTYHRIAIRTDNT